MLRAKYVNVFSLLENLRFLFLCLNYIDSIDFCL